MPEALLSPSPLTVSSRSGSPFQLLCACCSAKPDPDQVARISGWQFANFDWEEFIRIAEHHGVLALAARNLLDHAETLPSDVRRSLEEAYATSFRRGLWFAAELMRVSRHLAEKGIRTIPYKGPALAQSGYGDLALRSFNDLDLLIAPADFVLAREALAEIGYKPSKILPPAVERLWLRTGYERSFDGPAGKNLLELQWALLPGFYAVDLEHFQFEQLWSRASQTNLGAGEAPSVKQGDGAVPCLSPEDALLILCLHAAKHLWTRLIWIADIAESSRAPSVNFDLVISHARSLGMARILGVSLWLAKSLLGMPILANAQTLIASDSEIPKIACDCVSRLSRCTSYNFESTEYFMQVRHLRERSRDRRRYLWRLLWTPGEADIEAIALPEAAHFLYGGVRVVRLLRKFAIPK